MEWVNSTLSLRSLIERCLETFEHRVSSNQVSLTVLKRKTILNTSHAQCEGSAGRRKLMYSLWYNCHFFWEFFLEGVKFLDFWLLALISRQMQLNNLWWFAHLSETILTWNCCHWPQAQQAVNPPISRGVLTKLYSEVLSSLSCHSPKLSRVLEIASLLSWPLNSLPGFWFSGQVKPNNQWLYF